MREHCTNKAAAGFKVSTSCLSAIRCTSAPTSRTQSIATKVRISQSASISVYASNNWLMSEYPVDRLATKSPFGNMPRIKQGVTTFRNKSAYFCNQLLKRTHASIQNIKHLCIAVRPYIVFRSMIPYLGNYSFSMVCFIPLKWPQLWLVFVFPSTGLLLYQRSLRIF